MTGGANAGASRKEVTAETASERGGNGRPARTVEPETLDEDQPGLAAIDTATELIGDP
jgi:hypothetical protein